MAVDDVNTIVLLHFNGDDGSTTFTDESGKIWTGQGAVLPELDTAQKQFGTASCLFGAFYAPYISSPWHSDFDIGNNDWTFDCWFRLTNIPAPGSYGGLFHIGPVASADSLEITIYSDTSIHVRNGSTDHAFTVPTILVNTWYHIAVEHNNTAETICVYLGGVGSVTNPISSTSHPSTDSGDTTIGCSSVGRVKGWLDEVRISNKVRYNGDFTPRTAEYERIERDISDDVSATFETDADVYGWRFIAEDASVSTSFLDNMGEFSEDITANFYIFDNLADWLSGASANVQFLPTGIFNTDLYEETTTHTNLQGTVFYDLLIEDGFDPTDTSDRNLRYSLDIADGFVFASLSDGIAQKIGNILDGVMIWDAALVGWGKTVPDTFALADAPSTPLCLIIPDVLTLVDAQFNLWDGVHTIEESAVIRDSYVFAQYLKSIADTMDLADLPRLLLSMPISDWLTLSDSVPLLIKAAILESMLMSDTSLWGWDKTIADTFATADAPSALATFNRAIAESLALASAASFLKTCGVSVPDTMALTDVSASAVKLYNIILESLALNVLLDLDGELWECFVLNTPAFHASMYSGYNFNSFCVFNGRAFGANDSGIFELTGSTDTGNTIHTGVILKGTDFGAPNQKRMRRGYFGVSGSSPVLILETESGQRQVYNIDTKGKTVASHELKSKSWNLSIADFDALDSVKLIPVILSK